MVERIRRLGLNIDQLLREPNGGQP
jgi:hypothetical protein